MKQKKISNLTPSTSSTSGVSGLDFNKKTPEEAAALVVADLEKHGLQSEEEITVRNPISGRTAVVKIERDGTPESKLIVALADKEMPRDKKDHVLSMYLWERGHESSSFLVDLMRYKGAFAKESHAFKSQMRFDFEMFVNTFVKYLDDQVAAFEKNTNVKIREEMQNYLDWLKLPNNADASYADYVNQRDKGLVSRLNAALIYGMMQTADEANKLRQVVDNLTKDRERRRGKGIYVSAGGTVYTHNDPDMDDIIKADREREAQENQI